MNSRDSPLLRHWCSDAELDKGLIVACVGSKRSVLGIGPNLQSLIYSTTSGKVSPSRSLHTLYIWSLTLASKHNIPRKVSVKYTCSPLLPGAKRTDLSTTTHNNTTQHNNCLNKHACVSLLLFCICRLIDTTLFPVAVGLPD